MIYPEIIGNRQMKGRLESMLSSGRLPHAIVIEGPVGSGRRSLARLLAKTVACTGENRPCGGCPACRNGLSNPDITEVDADKAILTVDTVRELRNQAYVKAMQSAMRVFIIPNAQRMNRQAQNALLKVLEEPPAGVLFLLTCDYTRQLLETVVSRVTVLTMESPEPEEIEEYILSNYDKYSADAVHGALDGTVGATLARLEGQEGYLELARQVALALTGSELSLLKLLKPLEKNREGQKGLCLALGGICQEALSVGMGAPREFGEQDVRRQLAASFTPQQLLDLTEVCREAAVSCEFNMGGGLFVTLFGARLFRAVQ